MAGENSFTHGTQLALTIIVALIIVCLAMYNAAMEEHHTWKLTQAQDTVLTKKIDTLLADVHKLAGYKAQMDSIQLRLDSLFAYNKIKDSVFTYQNLWIREADEAFPWLDQQIKEDLKPAIPMRRK